MLLANFPIAVICALWGADIATRHIVDVINKTENEIHISIVAQPADHHEASLSRRARFRTRLDAEGEVLVTVTQSGKTETIVAQGYACKYIGFHSRVHIKPGLASTVEQLR